MVLLRSPFALFLSSFLLRQALMQAVVIFCECRSHFQLIHCECNAFTCFWRCFKMATRFWNCSVKVFEVGWKLFLATYALKYSIVSFLCISEIPMEASNPSLVLCLGKKKKKLKGAINWLRIVTYNLSSLNSILLLFFLFQTKMQWRK